MKDDTQPQPLSPSDPAQDAVTETVAGMEMMRRLLPYRNDPAAIRIFLQGYQAGWDDSRLAAIDHFVTVSKIVPKGVVPYIEALLDAERTTPNVDFIAGGEEIIARYSQEAR